MNLEIIGKNAKAAAGFMASLSSAEIDNSLICIADEIIKNKDEILKENLKDIEAAKENGIKDTMIDRLRLDSDRIDGIANAVKELVALKSPLGNISKMEKRPNGLVIGKMRVPLGVLAIIYESRPNVTVDASVLALKAGNAVVLRGGKEAINSNIALAKVMRDALEKLNINKNAIQIIEDTKRETATALMKLNEYVDVLIPRGGGALIKSVVENATISVLETGVGNCHIYADKGCDLDMAVDIIYNAKTQRPSVCNAAESLLVHEDIAFDLLPLVAKSLSQKNVEIRGCEKTKKIIDCAAASDEDYYEEFLDYIISVKVVSGVEEAIAHINKYSSHHSEAIITKDYANSQLFLAQVDSAAVYVNASTRFTDGGEFGLGAEVGISTQKLHARGPMGLEALTTEKYIIYGNGQVR